MVNYQTLFDREKHRFANLQRLPLLKKIEAVTGEIFKTDPTFEKQRQVLGEKKEPQVLKAVLESNFEGIKEYSAQFYQVYQVAAEKQVLTKYFVQQALINLDHRFNEFDQTLLIGTAKISLAYDEYYLSWIKSV